MTSYHLTLATTALAFVACCIRARLLACAFLPAFALILARSAGFVDTSSAHHPLRFAVPILGLSVAMVSAYYYASQFAYAPKADEEPLLRSAYASLLVFASCCVDIPATLLWDVPGVFLVQPLQTLACFGVVACLFVPERWRKWKP